MFIVLVEFVSKANDGVSHFYILLAKRPMPFIGNSLAKLFPFWHEGPYGG